MSNILPSKPVLAGWYANLPEFPSSVKIVFIIAFLL